MDYKSTTIDELKESLKQGIVTFEFKKKDGTIRTAKGTTNASYLEDELEDEVITLDKNVVDDYIDFAGYQSIEEYASRNNTKFVGEVNGMYTFETIKKTKKPNDNIVSYFDIEKQEFRSFVKENYMGLVEIEDL